jgi:hypothetical protein
VIAPALPELRDDQLSPALEGEYSSRDAVVTGDALLALVAEADFVDSAMSGLHPVSAATDPSP